MSELAPINTLPALPVPIADTVARYRTAMIAAQPDIAKALLRRAALDLWKAAAIADTVHPEQAKAIRLGIADELHDMSVLGQIDLDVAQSIFAEAQDPGRLDELTPDVWPTVERVRRINGSSAAPLRADISSEGEAAAPRLVQTITEFVAGYVAPDFLIEGLLLKHFCYSLTGTPGSGKTALGLLIAALIASRSRGQKFGPHEVEHGRVVYIAAENATDSRMRLIGMAAKKKLDVDPSDFLVIEQVRNLDDDLPRIRSEIEKFGDVDLVIVDTSPSLFRGDNENDTVQMLNHAKRLRMLCDLPGRPTVLAMCHPTKHVSGPDNLLPRGGGAFIGELDGNLSLWAHDDRLADLHWCGKIRGPDFAKITIRLVPVTTTELVDKKGRLLPTVMAEVVSDDEVCATAKSAIAQEDQLLVAMLHRPRATFDEWASACRWFVNGDPNKPNKTAVHRVMKRLEEDKLVSKQGRNFIVTKTGKATAKNIGAALDEASDLGVDGT